MALDLDHLPEDAINYLNKSLRTVEVEKHRNGFRVARATQEDSVVLELVVLVCEVLDDHQTTDKLSLLKDSEVFNARLILCLCLQGFQAGSKQSISNSDSLLFSFITIEMSISGNLIKEQADILVEGLYRRTLLKLIFNFCLFLFSIQKS